MSDPLANTWSEALSVADEALNLGWLATLIAKGEYPELDPEVTLASLDTIAAQVNDAGGDLAALRHVLFDELGFKGNQDSYYEPTNSYLNDVLEQRTGIPITLCVLLIEVGARCGQSLAPVSFPGHFLARTDLPDGTAQFIDAFHGGIVQDEDTLIARLRQLTGQNDLPEAFVASAFMPCSKREVVARMLRNLKQIYVQQRDWPRALRVSDQLLHVQPSLAEHYRDRGQLYAQVGHTAAAQADLSRYLQMVSDVREKARVRDLLTKLAGQSQRLN